MATLQRKSFDQPDETRPVDKGKVEVVEMDGATVMRTTFEPGWRARSVSSRRSEATAVRSTTSATRSPAECTW